MRINSVSQLSSLPANRITLAELSTMDSYIETSVSAGVENDISIYNSCKLPFHEYNALIVNEINGIKDYIDGKVESLCSYIDDLCSYITNILDDLESALLQFIDDMNQDFVHKVREYTLTIDGVPHTYNFNNEEIYGTKVFHGNVGVDGANSLLSASQVIEGIARKALWG